MILVTSEETGMLAHVDDTDIVQITSHGTGSRIYLVDKRQNHEFFLDVLEDPKEVKHRIKYEKLDLGCEAKSYFEEENL